MMNESVVLVKVTLTFCCYFQFLYCRKKKKNFLSERIHCSFVQTMLEQLHLHKILIKKHVVRHQLEQLKKKEEKEKDKKS